MKCLLTPSTTEGAVQAGRLFGFDRILTGDWLISVNVSNVTEDEFSAAEPLLKEIGFTLHRGMQHD